MPFTELDAVRAQYLWALHRHAGTFDAQVRDLGRVLDTLVRAERERRNTDPEPCAPVPALRELIDRLARAA